MAPPHTLFDVRVTTGHATAGRFCGRGVQYDGPHAQPKSHHSAHSRAASVPCNLTTALRKSTQAWECNWTGQYTGSCTHVTKSNPKPPRHCLYAAQASRRPHSPKACMVQKADEHETPPTQGRDRSRKRLGEGGGGTPACVRLLRLAHIKGSKPHTRQLQLSAWSASLLVSGPCTCWHNMCQPVHQLLLLLISLRL